jgi:hypothetical protein
VWPVGLKARRWIRVDARSVIQPEAVSAAGAAVDERAKPSVLMSLESRRASVHDDLDVPGVGRPYTDVDRITLDDLGGWRERWSRIRPRQEGTHPAVDFSKRDAASGGCAALAQTVLVQFAIMSATMLPAQEILRAVVADHARREAERLDAIRRVMADYREMPGLNVTLAQGSRLWSLPPELCASILDQLIAQGYLKRRGKLYSCS